MLSSNFFLKLFAEERTHAGIFFKKLFAEEQTHAGIQACNSFQDWLTCEKVKGNVEYHLLLNF